MAITIVFVVIAIWLAKIKGYSIISLVSEKADKAFVNEIITPKLVTLSNAKGLSLTGSRKGQDSSPTAQNDTKDMK
jgi:hypothetical protein